MRFSELFAALLIMANSTAALANPVFIVCHLDITGTPGDKLSETYLRIDTEKSEISFLQKDQSYFNSCKFGSCKFDENFYSRSDPDGGWLKINRKTGAWESGGAGRITRGFCEKSSDQTKMPNRF